MRTNNFEETKEELLIEITHNPFKSDIFSCGLLVLRMMG